MSDLLDFSKPLCRPARGWRGAWQRWWGRHGGQAQPEGRAWVPVRPLHARHRVRIETHLLAMSEGDRYLRFGYAATDEQIRRYAQGIRFDRDEILGVFNRRLQLIAVAHLSYADEPSLNACAEFGVSVLSRYRGRGLGGRLFEQAVMHARNHGVNLLFVHALSENTPMLRIARKAGARVEREGSESDAYLSLPAPTLDSRLASLVQDQAAEVDYRIKQQARQFLALLATLQEIRQGVRDARHPPR